MRGEPEYMRDVGRTNRTKEHILLFQFYETLSKARSNRRRTVHMLSEWLTHKDFSILLYEISNLKVQFVYYEMEMTCRACGREYIVYAALNLYGDQHHASADMETLGNQTSGYWSRSKAQIISRKCLGSPSDCTLNPYRWKTGWTIEKYHRTPFR